MTVHEWIMLDYYPKVQNQVYFQIVETNPSLPFTVSYYPFLKFTNLVKFRKRRKLNDYDFHVALILISLIILLGFMLLLRKYALNDVDYAKHTMLKENQHSY